jgi:hypothetical protein
VYHLLDLVENFLRPKLVLMEDEEHATFFTILEKEPVFNPEFSHGLFELLFTAKTIHSRSASTLKCCCVVLAKTRILPYCY